MAFDLFQPAPTSEARPSTPPPAAPSGGVDLFTRPPEPGAASEPEAAPEPPAAPESAPESPAPALDLFSRPPIEPPKARPAPEPVPEARESEPEPAPEAPAAPPAAPSGVDLFTRPPDPSSSTPEQEAPRAPRAPRGPAAPDVEFSNEERAAFNQFSAPPKKFRNPDTQQDVQFGSLPDPEQARVRKEWLQRFRQSQQQQPEPDYLRDPKNQVEKGDILGSLGAYSDIKVIQVLDSGDVEYKMRGRSGDYLGPKLNMPLSKFLERRYTLKERPQPEQAPESERQQMPRSRAIPEGFETVEDLKDFKPGDGFYEDGFRGQELHKVKRVDDGVLVAEGGTHYYADEIEKQRGGGYLRKPGSEAAPEPESSPEAVPEAAPDPDRERPFGDVRDPADLEGGDFIQTTDRYNNAHRLAIRRVGDKLMGTTFGGWEGNRIGRPVEMTAEWLKREKAKRIEVSALPRGIQQNVVRGLAPIKDERVQEPRQMRHKGIMRVGEGDDAKQYYVTKVDGDTMKVQEYDPASERRYGRPKNLTAQDLKDKEFSYVQQNLPPRRKPSGTRLSRLDPRVREGKIVKIFSDKKPTWARIVSVSRDTGGMTLQRVNARTGRNIGEPEEFTGAELADWAHVRRINTLPRKLQPPPKKLTGPAGEDMVFAEKGQGDLTPNFQPDRYADVDMVAGHGTVEAIRTLLGDKLGDRDPLEVAADLAGAGGIAGKLRRLSISAGSRSISVTGFGPGVEDMGRTMVFEGGKPKYISNTLFKVKGTKGKGTGTKMLATQVAMARELGFEYIKTSAAGGPGSAWKGYYAWPALGYSAPFPTDYWGRMPEEMRAKVLEVYPRKEDQEGTGMPTGLDFVHVMAAGTPVRDWWRAKGRGREMTFPLGDDSLSVSALTKYVREKAEAGNVGADEFLQRAASMSLMAMFLAAQEKDDDESGAEVEEAPEFDDEDEKILDNVWEQMREEIIGGR